MYEIVKMETDIGRFGAAQETAHLFKYFSLKKLAMAHIFFGEQDNGWKLVEASRHPERTLPTQILRPLFESAVKADDKRLIQSFGAIIPKRNQESWLKGIPSKSAHAALRALMNSGRRQTQIPNRVTLPDLPESKVPLFPPF